jgi:hypothetical protein
MDLLGNLKFETNIGKINYSTNFNIAMHFKIWLDFYSWIAILKFELNIGKFFNKFQHCTLTSWLHLCSWIAYLKFETRQISTWQSNKLVTFLLMDLTSLKILNFHWKVMIWKGEYKRIPLQHFVQNKYQKKKNLGGNLRSINRPLVITHTLDQVWSKFSPSKFYTNAYLNYLPSLFH